MGTEFKLVRQSDFLEDGVVDFLINDVENVEEVLGQGCTCEEVKTADGPEIDEADEDEGKREDLK